MATMCPTCGKGRLRRDQVREEMFGIDLGTYLAEVCDACGESYLDSEATAEIEGRAKKLGLWGLAQKVRISRSGNSLVVRIPADLVKFLKLKGGQEALVRPDGRERIVVELG